MKGKVMKVKDMEGLMYSEMWDLQHVRIWDSKELKEWDIQPTIEYLIANHPDLEVKRIQAYKNFLVFTI